MKKLIVVVVVLSLLVSLVAYGDPESGWREDGDMVKLREPSDEVLIGEGTRSAVYFLDKRWWSGLLSAPESPWGDKGSYVISIDQRYQYNRYFVIQSKDTDGRGAGNPLLLIESYTGNVGIGATELEEKLTVNGNIKLKGTNRKIIAPDGLTIVGCTGEYAPATLKLDQASNTYLYGGNGGGSTEYNVILAHTGSQAWGRVGIGTNIPDERLHVNGNSIITGNVGIGTTSLDYKLNVNGTIKAKEIKVKADWSDFVFADNYKLMSLDKLEQHIKVNKSLPGIPTEKEVKENGVKVGEMQAKLLEKVEELTLYVIEQNKKISELEEKIARLEAEN